MLTVSPTAMFSSENVVNETASETTLSTSECGSSRRVSASSSLSFCFQDLVTVHVERNVQVYICKRVHVKEVSLRLLSEIPEN